VLGGLLGRRTERLSKAEVMAGGGGTFAGVLGEEEPVSTPPRP